VKKNNDDIEALLKDLLEYSKLYAIILNPMQYQNSFTAVLVRLSQLEFTVIFPVVLAILKRWNEKNLTDQEVTELLRVTEIFLFRRLIVGLATNALSKIFATLDKDVTKKAQSSQLASYAEIYKYVLLNKEESSRFLMMRNLSKLFLAVTFMP
jgi:hypothetical protein